MRGVEALRRKDYDAAVRGLREAIAVAPERTSIRKDLAYTYLKIGENEKARGEFGAAIRLDPDDHQVALEYPFLSYEAKAEARRIFDRIRRKGNRVAQDALQNIEEPLWAAIERWKAAVAAKPGDSGLHYDLARVAEQREELALARPNTRKQRLDRGLANLITTAANCVPSPSLTQAIGKREHELRTITSRSLEPSGLRVDIDDLRTFRDEPPREHRTTPEQGR
jgi:tetratricopeptide (TPR) repeat protein